MRPGKVSQTILKRSVLKNITYKSGRLLTAPRAGMDCARYAGAGGQDLIFTVNPVSGLDDELGRTAFFRMCNDLAAAGAVPCGLLADICLPEGSSEPKLRLLMEQITALAKEYQMDILGGHTEVSRAVSEPRISLTGFGEAAGMRIDSGCLEPGMEIVMTKWAGDAGSYRLAKQDPEGVRSRFSADFFECLAAYGRDLSCAGEARMAVQYGAKALHNGSEDGVFGALWEMGEASGVGLEVELEAIPIRQETVEVCEYFDENPYLIPADGVLLIGAPEGRRLAEDLRRHGVAAAVIGRAAGNRDRVIINGDERRFLVPPGRKEERE